MKSAKRIIASLILLLMGLAVFLIVSNQSGFTGERTKNPDSYILNIQHMNGTDSHMLNLTAGDVLQVEFETKKGYLHMEITASDGTVLYAGNGKEATNFEINISKSGSYVIAVESRHANGIIHIQRKEQAQ